MHRTSSAGTKVVQANTASLTPDLKSALKIQAHVHAERSEMLFSRRALLVEGQTEKIAMPFILGAMGIDANREGISIVDCGGKESLPFFLRLAQSFGIPCVVVADLDPGKPQQATQNLQKECPQGNLFLLDPDFETVSGYSAGDKIVEAYKHFSLITQQQLPSPLVQAVNRLLTI